METLEQKVARLQSATDAALRTIAELEARLTRAEQDRDVAKKSMEQIRQNFALFRRGNVYMPSGMPWAMMGDRVQDRVSGYVPGRAGVVAITPKFSVIWEQPDGSKQHDFDPDEKNIQPENTLERALLMLAWQVLSISNMENFTFNAAGAVARLQEEVKKAHQSIDASRAERIKFQNESADFIDDEVKGEG